MQPSSFEVVIGDLLEEPGWKFHQCNCVSKEARGIAKAIFAKWPETNVYARRKEPSIMGTIELHQSAKVINAFAQRYPGGTDSTVDSPDRRLDAFANCLRSTEIELHRIAGFNPIELAFPFGIGCGLAKGNWLSYMTLLIQSYERLNALHGCVHYRIVKL